MIHELTLFPPNATPGETVELTVIGHAPFKVAFACFVDKPPPPGFRECAACKTYKVAESPWAFTVPDFFEGSNGRLKITVTDAKGSQKQVALEVSGLAEGTGLTATA